jgi:hypothetical protein
MVSWLVGWLVSLSLFMNIFNFNKKKNSMFNLSLSLGALKGCPRKKQNTRIRSTNKIQKWQPRN